MLFVEVISKASKNSDLAIGSAIVILAISVPAGGIFVASKISPIEFACSQGLK
jgi:hypothetical protein